jgi:hypothetical protein
MPPSNTVLRARRLYTRIGIGILCLQSVAGCSFEGIRMHERQRCGAMPESLATQCYRRTQDTKAEYEAKRRQLEHAVKDAEKRPDPRYEQWIP